MFIFIHVLIFIEYKKHNLFSLLENIFQGQLLQTLSKILCLYFKLYYTL